MKWHKLFIALAILLFYSLAALCQDSKYVYEDSAILYPEAKQESVISAPEEATVGSDEQVTQAPKTIYVDTSLVNNGLIISKDSVKYIKNAKAFAYAKILDSLLKDYQDKQQATNNEPASPSFLERFFSAELTKVLFWIIGVSFIGFIVYKLFFTAGFFQLQTAKSTVTLLDEHTKDVTGTSDYDSLISHAIKNNNLRLAVRYLYLQTLQKLTSAGAIEFAVDKTNAAYLRELSGKPYKNEFAALTLHYEYVWYGEFAINESVFTTLQSRFKALNNRI